MNEIGELLRLTRESSGVSIEEASKDLNIQKEILDNIENGRSGAFKDMLELKETIRTYSKYLGIDEEKITDLFNEYMFEYTSKIPIKDIEKTIELKIKEEDKKKEISSPYTHARKKYNKKVYILIYFLLIILTIFAIVWAVKQVTVDRSISNTISYKE